MKSIVLVHGISSDGEWQDIVEPVLKDFFPVKKVRYREFRRLGEVAPAVRTVV